MRTWLLHPILFYPLVALMAALVIAISAKPQSWPRAPAAVSGQRVGGALVLSNDAFGAPAESPDQQLTVTRDALGHAQSLRIAVLPDRPAPGPTDRGVRLLLEPEAAVSIAGRPATILVTYNPLPVNAANGLAVSLQGHNPATWVTQSVPPQHGTLRFEVPAQAGVNAIGLRAISSNDNEAYGLEITRISISPHP